MATIVRLSGLMVLAIALMTLVAPSVARGDVPEGPRHPHPALIAGTIFDSNGDPVAGASVVLGRRGNAIQRTMTNDEGRFHFEAVRPGVYGIRAAKEGVGRGARRLFARPGRNLVRVRLR